MKPNIARTTLKMTAGLTNQFPQDSKPQIAFVGRSNVGKSSMINTLLGRKNYARVSQQPGKTITINFYDVDNCFYLVDLPGYGYAKRAPEDKAKWSALTDGYFTADAEKITAVAQLVDLKVGTTADDEIMLDFLNRSGIKYFIVATKSDKPNKTERAAALEKLRANPLIAADADIILFSAQTGEGKDAVIKELFKFV